MDIKVVRGDVTQHSAPAVMVNLFEGVTQPGGATGAIDRAMKGAITKLISDGEIKGKKGELTLIYSTGQIGADRVLVVGLGKEGDFNQDVVRDVTADACRFLRRKSITSAATIAHGAGIGGLDPFRSAQAIAEGAILGLYRFSKYKSNNEDSKDFAQLEIVEREPGNLSALERGVETGRTIAEATCIARDMVNEPANILTPTRMAEIALDIAQRHGLEITVFDREHMERMGMGGLLGVAKGSVQPPKFIVLKHRGDPSNPENNLGILGKGITFDSGGISLKHADRMEDMKGDMAGGAAAIAAVKAIAQLGVRLNVSAVVAATENMPSGSAQRPGDIIRTMSGKTIEIINTDAEGRLVLADAITYARSVGLKRIVDMATLTGAVVIALGNVCTGVIGNDQALIEQVIKAGQSTGEKFWQLPLFPEYRDQIKSDVADMKNTGGREAGAITAAHLLKEFAEDTSWAHLDIAGTFFNNRGEKGALVKGATGAPVRTMVELASELASM